MYELDPQSLIDGLDSHLELIRYTIQSDIPERVKSVSLVFTNLIESMTTKFREILSKLKVKAKDLS